MGAVFALFAAWFFWTPKAEGLTYNDRKGRLHFWGLFVGVKKKLAPSLVQLNKILFDTRKSYLVLNNNYLNYIKDNYSVNFIYFFLYQFKLNNSLFKFFTLTNNYPIAQLVEVKNSGNNITEIQKASQRLNTKDIERLPLIFFGLDPNKEVYGKLSNTDEKIHPLYITGLSDAESIFALNLTKKDSSKGSWHIQPIFIIELQNINALLLKRIQSFFAVGIIRENILHNNNKNFTTTYTVESIKDFINVIIPHFNKYPLLTKKRADFELLKQIVEVLFKKEHLSYEELQKIVKFKGAKNRSLSTNFKKLFHNIVPVNRPIFENSKIIEPNWLLGFIENKGRFEIKLLCLKINWKDKFN